MVTFRKPARDAPKPVLATTPASYSKGHREANEAPDGTCPHAQLSETLDSPQIKKHKPATLIIIADVVSAVG
jgi:hypothetical protein